MRNLVWAAVFAAGALVGPAAAGDASGDGRARPQSAELRAAQQAIREGNDAEALAAVRRELAANPNSTGAANLLDVLGQHRRGAQGVPARHRRRRGARGQGERAARHGDVVRVRRRLRQHREVRADGDRLLGDARSRRSRRTPSTSRARWPTRRRASASMRATWRTRRDLVSQGHRTRAEGAGQPDASEEPVGLPAGARAGAASRRAAATRPKRRSTSRRARKICWTAMRRWPRSRSASSRT